MQQIGPLSSQPLDLAIKQGESSTVRIAIPATKANGDPLDSYDGWTAKVSLFRIVQGAAEIELEPTAVGDPSGKQFIVDLVFETDKTSGINTGKLTGDLALIEPSNERHYPVNITLTIERSYSTEAA